MNLILGTGVPALLARHILGPEYKFIQAGPSRFFNLNPTPADNFILANDNLKYAEDRLKSFVDTKVVPYNCAWSSFGQLNSGFDKTTCISWLAKIFGVHIPTHFQHVLSSRMHFNVFNSRTNQLYAGLYDKYKNEVKNANTIDNIKSIEPHKIIFKDNSEIEFEKCISTIPLDDLSVFCGNPINLPSINLAAYVVKTQNLNFEGNNQIWVSDPEIDFFKVIMVKPDEYVLFFTKQIKHIGHYLNGFMDEFDLLTGVFIKNAIPAGGLVSPNWLKDFGITTVGMSAQWDCAMDMSSCLYRLLKIADGEINV